MPSLLATADEVIEWATVEVGFGSMLSKKGLRLAANSDSAFPTR
jgi:hypothetical protein